MKLVLVNMVILCGCLAGIGCGGDALAAEAARPALVLKEKTILEKPSPLRGAFYVNKTGIEMMTYGARSADNGRTWVQQAPQPDFTTGLPENYRRSPYPGFVDPEKGALLTVMLAMDREDVDRAIDEPKETATDSYIRYRASLDGGKTFLFDADTRNRTRNGRASIGEHGLQVDGTYRKVRPSPDPETGGQDPRHPYRCHQ